MWAVVLPNVLGMSKDCIDLLLKCDHLPFQLFGVHIIVIAIYHLCHGHLANI